MKRIIYSVFTTIISSLLACSSAKTAENCGEIQRACVEKKMCVISSNSGKSGGSGGGSYGGGGISANGSGSDEASCDIQCMPTKPDGSCANVGISNTTSSSSSSTTSSSSSSGNPIGTSSGNSASSSGSSSTSSGSASSASSSSSGGVATYDAWSACFDPSETYPTGLLKYSSCSDYCLGAAKKISKTCAGPNHPDNGTIVANDTLIWCGYPNGICENISLYPNYIAACYQPGMTIDSKCIIGMDTAPKWTSIIPCKGKSSGSVATSAQCCCI